MPKRLNAKTRSDMSGAGSSGVGDMSADLWGDVYDMLCAKIKADDAYAKIRSKMRKLTEPKKSAPKKTIQKILKKKPSKPAATATAVTATAAAAAAAAASTPKTIPTTTTPTPTPTAGVVTTTAATPTTTTTTTTTTAAAAMATDTGTKGTSFLKPATPATPAKRRSRKALSLKISHQHPRTPDAGSAQSVLDQWWEHIPREPTYSPNGPETMTAGDSDEHHDGLKLATLPSMDLDTPTLLDASWSPASPEEVPDFSSGMPTVCDDDNVDQDPYGEAQLTPLQRECSVCRHNNMLRYISCNSGQVMCHLCFKEAIDCTCFMNESVTCAGPIWESMTEGHILW